jgi:quercetin dioxygenase-like cupin family protein
MFDAVRQVELDLEALPWVPIEKLRPDLEAGTENVSGIDAFLLTHDPSSGAMTYVVRIPPGWRTEGEEVHSFDQQSLTLAGSIMTDLDSDPVTLNPGSYRCTPAGTVHGPSFTEEGCVSLQIHSGAVTAPVPEGTS